MKNATNIFPLFFPLFVSTVITAQSETQSASTWTNTAGLDDFDGVIKTSVSDNSYNYIDFGADESAGGYFGGFGFSIPANATLTNISFTMEARWSSNSTRDEFRMYLRNPSGDKGLIVDNRNYFNQTDKTNTASDDDADLALFSLVIGDEITPAIINDTDFGILFENITAKSASAFFYVDLLEVTISYTTPLPVELFAYEVVERDGFVDIAWSTQSEINNELFIVEKSRDGAHWEEVESIEGAGNSLELLDYTLTDFNPYGGTSYYRLTQVDYNGLYETFGIKSVELSDREDLVIYPNPVNSNSTVYGLKDAYEVYDISGRMVFNETVYSSTESVDFSFLPSGHYVLVSGEQSFKFVK